LITALSPEKTSLRLERITGVEFPVEIAWVDALPEGYQAVNITLVPDTVVLEDKESLISRAARVVVSLNPLTEKTSITKRVSVYTDTGDVISQFEGKIPITINYDIARIVPVSTSVKGVPEEDWYVSAYRLEPSSIQVTGELDTLTKLTGLQASAIDVSGKSESFVANLEVTIPSGMKLYRSNPAIVANIEMEMLETRTVTIPASLVEVNDIDLALGVDWAIRDEEFRVTLKGKPEDLANFRSNAVVFAISVADLAAGEHLLPISITLPPTLKLIGQNFLTVDGIEVLLGRNTDTDTRGNDAMKNATWLLRDIAIPLEQISPENEHAVLAGRISKLSGLPGVAVQNLRIIRESIDARKKNQIACVYTVRFQTEGKPSGNCQLYEPADTAISENSQPLTTQRPVIVGAGPAGLFCAWTMAHNGLKPILVERGKRIEERAKDVDRFWQGHGLQPDSNVQFGEGGAGAFSDGKLTTRIHDARCESVLATFAECGAPLDIQYKAKPHIGTDKLRAVIRKMREQMMQMGVEFRFSARVTKLALSEGRVSGVHLADGSLIETDTVVLAIGHSARDTFSALFEQGISMEPKAFSVGVRIEHPQLWVNDVQYGGLQHFKLGAADYQLFERFGERTAYTFCMCPGGVVVGASSEEGGIVTNGMSYSARGGVNANSAFVVSVTPKDWDGIDALAGIRFQRSLEQAAYRVGGDNFAAPVQRLGDFMAGSTSTTFGSVKPSFTGETRFSDMNELLPRLVRNSMKDALPAFERRMKGFVLPDAILTGVETRTSSPIRILRNEVLQSTTIAGLYPAGEGAGYAGGIMSAAVDGMRVAETICGIGREG
jgi:uncharacterized protein